MGRRKPKLTSVKAMTVDDFGIRLPWVMVVSGLVSLLAGVTAGVALTMKLITPPVPDFQQQMAQLEETSKSLETLQKFVKAQQSNLRDAQKTVDLLKQEQEKLEPVVQIRREVIDAVFAVQEDRQKGALATERWIGFFIGIAVEAFVTAVAALATWAWKRWKFKTSASPPPSPHSPDQP